MRRLSAAAVATGLALGAPAATLAQSAGDDQYRDPFAGDEQRNAGDDVGDVAEPAPTPAPAAQPTSSAPAAPLPYTGLPAIAVAGAGVLLLAAGIGLRRSSR